jgi:hypothetical protein
MLSAMFPMMLNRIVEWCGAAAMVAAPFIIDTNIGKALAITGLAMLSSQALRLKAYNLLALNLLGIMGYCYAIYF